MATVVLIISHFLSSLESNLGTSRSNRSQTGIERTLPFASYLIGVHLFWIVHYVYVFMLWFIVTSHVVELICIEYNCKLKNKLLKEENNLPADPDQL